MEEDAEAGIAEETAVIVEGSGDWGVVDFIVGSEALVRFPPDGHAAWFKLGDLNIAEDQVNGP
jgi:hypothetical protein